MLIWQMENTTRDNAIMEPYPDPATSQGAGFRGAQWWAKSKLSKMTKVTLYRADDYNSSIGNLVGFYNDIEEAEMNIEHKNPGASPDEYPQSQITAFTIDFELAETLDYKDHQRMLAEDVWGSGEIIYDICYD